MKGLSVVYTIRVISIMKVYREWTTHFCAGILQTYFPPIMLYLNIKREFENLECRLLYTYINVTLWWHNGNLIENRIYFVSLRLESFALQILLSCGCSLYKNLTI